MPKIKRAVRNVTVESEKISYDPAKDKNWCHLPMEMRMECIRKMDFKTRTRLRATSKLEKSLVDSKKHYFDRVTVHLIGGELCVLGKIKHWSKDSVEVRMENWDEKDKNLNCLVNLLKMCDIKSFKIVGYPEEKEEEEDEEDEDDKEEGEGSHQAEALEKVDSFQEAITSVLNEIAKCAPFPFRHITVDSEDMRLMSVFLNNCTHLEKITFVNLEDPEFPVGEIIKIPSVLNVPELYFTVCNSLDPLSDLLQKWIEMDASLGKTLQFVTWHPDAVTPFVTKFEDRIIENTDNKEIRIRMDDESKQILLKKIGDHQIIGNVNWPGPKNYIMCKVIPMDLPKSEYASGVEWIDNLYEKEDPENYHLRIAMASDESNDGWSWWSDRDSDVSSVDAGEDDDE